MGLVVLLATWIGVATASDVPWVRLDELKPRFRPGPTLPASAAARYREDELSCEVELLVGPGGEVRWATSAPEGCPPSVADEVERVARTWRFAQTGRGWDVRTTVVFTWNVAGAYQQNPHALPSRPVVDEDGETRHLVNAELPRHPPELPTTMTGACDVHATVDERGRAFVLDVSGCLGPFDREARRSVFAMRFRPPGKGGFRFRMTVPFGG